MPFWRKKPDPRIARLEEADRILRTRFDEMARERDDYRSQVEYLVRTIREMDDKVFKMSQCSSWPEMRKFFVPLSEGMTARKVAESRRITELLVPELNKTFGPQGQLEKKP